MNQTSCFSGFLKKFRSVTKAMGNESNYWDGLKVQNVSHLVAFSCTFAP